MSKFQPADTLLSRTFIGLLIAQFLAAFNDQAIHASAMFFAINTHTLNEAQAISVMPILFFAPWAIFSTLAGYFADRYSKRFTLIFWKVAEIGITLLTVAGFWLVRVQGNPLGSWLVLSTVFLMGLHSAFFVPAKYGAMPEILQPRLLSRGNGVLESLSFLAIILGTVCGGVLSTWFRGQEYILGGILVGLAIIGAVASFMIEKIPVANPERRFPAWLYKPLFENIRSMLRSRPLAFAVVGIAFFNFVLTFMRNTVYLQGQTQAPPWPEAKTSEVVGMVALGIGLGSPLVGYLSGGKVEIGLLPIGAVGMIIAAIMAAFTLDWLPALVSCIALMGFFTGFYLVPLFTLLQHRAPKTSKGDAIATSNFINVTGGIVASAVFFLMDFIARQSGVTPLLPQSPDQIAILAEAPHFKYGRPSRLVFEGTEPRVIQTSDTTAIDSFRGRFEAGQEVVYSTYQYGDVTHYRIRHPGTAQEPAFDKRKLPGLLFFCAGGITLFILLVLWRLQPDLFYRTWLWLRSQGHYRLEVAGTNHVPSSGAALLATNCSGVERNFYVAAVVDRVTRFVLVERNGEAARHGFPRRRTLGILHEKGEPHYGEALRDKADRALHRGEVVAVPLADHPVTESADRVYEELAARHPVPVVPLFCEVETGPGGRHVVYVQIGDPLPAGTAAPDVRAALDRLRHGFTERRLAGESLLPREVTLH
jgi:MFS family permease